METSRALFERASQRIPGGVNSPVRACLGVSAEPVFIEKGYGSHITDVEGKEYIDFVMSWGPLLLGHCHPQVLDAAREALDKGSSFGAPCPGEVLLAEKVCEALPSVDMVRMVNSGTEATMSALRLARGYTGRTKVVKFEGCYHGHADAFLAAAGSGLATLSIPGTPGVPAATVQDTLLAPYNDLEAVRCLFEKCADDIAAIIVEPMAGNMGLVPPAEGFLQGLRDICDAYGAVLIFDEVITGFRLSYAGAQGRFGITPDLTTMGKIIGGGFPVGAYGGKREIMERIAPCGDVYQAGTLSGNPVAMATGLATLNVLEQADYAGLEARTKAFATELAAILKGKGAPVTLNTMASMYTLFFTDGPVTDFESAKKADSEMYASYYRQMRDAGVYLAPSGFECTMVSFAHTEQDFEQALEAAGKVEF
ncbi:glutamate-1-semialdehyde 2,1-aminomutase [Oceanidesulfovibrio marinus]|uniref:Glutamate-1-semialdehyde 2,1-aminomutase n=1 Tax=Oceanidesulfovibrio marinus TaxID=370038 RepID=A0A6P1ZE28_9BACT|nr:glutamate-1-semialdehyde 2,1-aminomutase [Oceanidesulfovibrio marinus]QJT09310.1 glutamate-1-semialdehyde-2,1-aminomutase [Oceanidesulfovibrio marinus]TVM32804.1 glutamate-1-semialdehyde-2,1-aminomutase [Oceanidesulfovibrio marinus]